MNDARSEIRAALADRWLLALIACGLLVRVALAVLLSDDMRLQDDEFAYAKQAQQFVNTGEFDTGWFVRPPLYFLFLAATQWLAPLLPFSWPLVAKLLQCVASAATVLPIYLSAQRIAGARAARLAAAFFLFDPTVIAYTHFLWPETLFLLAVALVFHGVSTLDRGSFWRELSLGVITGLAMLLKPVFGLFTLILAADWLLRLGWRPALRRALIFGGAAALTIAPWVIRNQLLYGPSIIIENQGPFNLWVGNAPIPPKQVLREWRQLDDPVTRSRVASQRGFEAIADDPGRFARQSVVRALNFWGFEFFAIRYITIGGYGDVPRGTLLLVFWVVQLGWALSFCCAAVGISTAGRDPTLRLILLYTAVFTLLVSAMVTTTRFRVPFAFWICIAAGVGADRLIVRRATRRNLAFAILATALLLGASASRPMFRKFISGDFDTAADFDRPGWRNFRY